MVYLRFLQSTRLQTTRKTVIHIPTYKNIPPPHTHTHFTFFSSFRGPLAAFFFLVRVAGGGREPEGGPSLVHSPSLSLSSPPVANRSVFCSSYTGVQCVIGLSCVCEQLVAHETVFSSCDALCLRTDACMYECTNLRESCVAVLFHRPSFALNLPALT